MNIPVAKKEDGETRSNVALVVRRFGSLDTEAIPEKAVPAGHVRVEVHFAGVGFTDLLAVAGNYPAAPRRPFSPGYEVSGVVKALGDGLDEGSKVRPGDRVCALCASMGGYRREVDIPCEFVVALPDELSLEVAAALPLNYVTALGLIEKSAALSIGDPFLIHGAGGGVGTATLEVGHALGLRAYGTASMEKHDLVRALGAVPLDYRDGRWLARARAAEPHGFAAVFDSFGGSVQRDSWRVVRRGGGLVSYGFYAGADARFSSAIFGMGFLLIKNVLPNGKSARFCATPGLAKDDPGWYRESLKRIFRWNVEGTLSPRIDSILPWRKVADAHDRLRRRRVQGKLLLDFTHG